MNSLLPLNIRASPVPWRTLLASEITATSSVGYEALPLLPSNSLLSCSLLSVTDASSVRGSSTLEAPATAAPFAPFKRQIVRMTARQDHQTLAVPILTYREHRSQLAPKRRPFLCTLRSLRILRPPPFELVSMEPGLRTTHPRAPTNSLCTLRSLLSRSGRFQRPWLTDARSIGYDSCLCSL